MSDSRPSPPAQQVKNEVRLDLPTLKELIQSPEPSPSTAWIWGAVASFVLVSSVLVFAPLDTRWNLFTLVVAFLIVLWCAAIVQLRWKNGVVTTIVLMGGVTLVLLAGGIIKPLDIPGMLRQNSPS